MEKAIESSITHLKDALDEMKNDACDAIGCAETFSGEMEAFWKYAKVLLEISAILEKAGYKA